MSNFNLKGAQVNFYCLLIPILMSGLFFYLRHLWFKKRNKIKSGYNWTIFIFLSAIVPGFVAFYCFRYLLFSFDGSQDNYETILSVLSLMATGAIAGMFVFTYQDAAKDESILASIIAFLYLSIIYILFGSISFYLGKSVDIKKLNELAFILPIVMALFLIIIILYNNWDYREA